MCNPTDAIASKYRGVTSRLLAQGLQARGIFLRIIVLHDIRIRIYTNMCFSRIPHFFYFSSSSFHVSCLTRKMSPEQNIKLNVKLF